MCVCACVRVCACSLCKVPICIWVLVAESGGVRANDCDPFLLLPLTASIEHILHMVVRLRVCVCVCERERVS